ncbi:MAG: TetR/AcrR family transcriptional regulator [Clostridiaceae bacterium]|jgi:AcrR family transcriptional regulator|nr:TetR/AcrR family transcriptional regulator [Clostridiaceae bacterium]
MKYENADAKERIMDTMVELLMERKDVNKITTRQIAERANVNVALINYYFQSKENLLNKAVEICMENIANKMFVNDRENELPVHRLKTMIKTISTFAFDNYYLSEIAISCELKNGGVNTSKMILPLLKEIFKEEKTEVELKTMAIQLIVPMQVIFLNAKAYKEYLLKDIFDEKQRNELLDKMIDNILNTRC